MLQNESKFALTKIACRVYHYVLLLLSAATDGEKMQISARLLRDGFLSLCFETCKIEAEEEEGGKKKERGAFARSVSISDFFCFCEITFAGNVDVTPRRLCLMEMKRYIHQQLQISGRTGSAATLYTLDTLCATPSFISPNLSMLRMETVTILLISELSLIKKQSLQRFLESFSFGVSQSNKKSAKPDVHALSQFLDVA